MNSTIAMIDGGGNPVAVIWTYLLYLAVSVALTIWVARTLHKNGRVFLVDSFLGNEGLADSVNHLLVVGFYLVNIAVTKNKYRVNCAICTNAIVGHDVPFRKI